MRHVTRIATSSPLSLMAPFVVFHFVVYGYSTPKNVYPVQIYKTSFQQFCYGKNRPPLKTKMTTNEKKNNCRFKCDGGC
ncbi:hypothetical protein OUZ56_008729 [Daphnia magna]|uniref:Secreted protein n=1 Tax=Daphnia magna TaxID=35525 RepID=A0ABR0ADV9_9CRUS|nr:hypothetical protein OUZ56_008729 [Daphnia magna]